MDYYARKFPNVDSVLVIVKIRCHNVDLGFFIVNVLVVVWRHKKGQENVRIVQREY